MRVTIDIGMDEQVLDDRSGRELAEDLAGLVRGWCAMRGIHLNVSVVVELVEGSTSAERIGLATFVDQKAGGA